MALVNSFGLVSGFQFGSFDLYPFGLGLLVIRNLQSNRTQSRLHKIRFAVL